MQTSIIPTAGNSSRFACQCYGANMLLLNKQASLAVYMLHRPAALPALPAGSTGQQQLDKFYAGFVKKSKPKSIVIVPGAKALTPAASQQQAAATPAQEQQLASSSEA